MTLIEALSEAMKKNRENVPATLATEALARAIAKGWHETAEVVPLLAAFAAEIIERHERRFHGDPGWPDDPVKATYKATKVEGAGATLPPASLRDDMRAVLDKFARSTRYAAADGCAVAALAWFQRVQEKAVEKAVNPLMDWCENVYDKPGDATYDVAVRTIISAYLGAVR